MSIYITVFKCICMHEYMYVCMHVCIVCIYTCVHASMCICMYVYMYACVHTCMYVIFKLGFERYRGGIVLVGRGNCPGGIVQGGNVRAPHHALQCETIETVRGSGKEGKYNTGNDQEDDS